MSPRSARQNQMIRGERREQILVAALAVFAARGLSATRISDIASAAGLSHGLVYHYFQSKEEIFTELASRAFLYARSTIIEAVNLPGKTPLEKIEALTRAIIPMSFQGFGPFMFQIVNQSYVSDHIPQKVKELATENMSVNAKYMAPLIAEGQRLGEVTEGDPLQMGIAYFAMIQGLGLIKAQTWEKFSIPDVPVIMNLFGKDASLQAGKHGDDQSAKLLPLVLNDSESTYRTKLPFSDQYVMEDASVVNLREDDAALVRITVNDRERDIRRVTLVESGSMKPLRTDVYNGKKIQKRIEYTDGSVTFTRFENKSKRRFGLGELYYDAYSLFQLLMSYPFGSGATIHFPLVLDGNLPIPIGPMDLYVKETGIETVEVPGGKFECYRLEMGISGALGVMAELSKSFFWYSVDSPHWPVRFESKNEDTFTEFVRAGR